MKVTVTKSHIQDGRRGSIYSCPVALALKDAGVPHPIVRSCEYLGSDVDWHLFPRHVEDAIRRYDKTGEMEPFQFEV